MSSDVQLSVCARDSIILFRPSTAACVAMSVDRKPVQRVREVWING